jgi:predicted MFS family arabinose efflux permease
VAAFLAMSALTFGAIEAGDHGFTSWVAATLFAVATLSFTAFLAWQRHAPHPIMPLELFRRRNVSLAVAVGFAFVVGYYGLPFVMSLYLQQLHGFSALRTGLVFLPMMVIGGVLTPFSAKIAERFGARLVVSTGLVVMAAGLVLLAFVASSASPLTVAALMLPVGVAGPLVMPPITAILLNSVPDQLAGTASGVFNTSRQLGGALAVAVFGALLGQPDNFIHGLRLSLSIAAVVAIAAAAVSRLINTPTKEASQ